MPRRNFNLPLSGRHGLSIEDIGAFAQWVDLRMATDVDPEMHDARLMFIECVDNTFDVLMEDALDVARSTFNSILEG